MTRPAGLLARAAFHALLVTAASLAAVCAQAAAPAKPAPVLVSAMHGDVRIATKGALVRVSTGMTLNLPATIRTGADGAVELRQGDTIVSAAANAELDIPLSADPAETLDRIIQSRGNVYYSVAKRTGSKLHVETRYLVAVIKGTQFNVSVTETGSTISLLEGLIELRSADGLDVIDLAAGQIGTISTQQPRIRVLQMATGDNVRAGLPALPVRGGTGTTLAADATIATSAAGTTGAVKADNRAGADVKPPVSTDATAVIASGTGAVPAVKDAAADSVTTVVADTASSARVIASNTVVGARERDSSVLAVETLISRVGTGSSGSGSGNTGSGNTGSGNTDSGNTGSGSGSGGSGTGAGDATDTSGALVPELLRNLKDLTNRGGLTGSGQGGTPAP